VKTIEIIVNPSGQTHLQTNGFPSTSCQEASRFLEEALGEKLAEIRTAEFFQLQDVQTRLREQS
jgi:hypothetical protein